MAGTRRGQSLINKSNMYLQAILDCPQLLYGEPKVKNCFVSKLLAEVVPGSKSVGATGRIGFHFNW